MIVFPRTVRRATRQVSQVSRDEAILYATRAFLAQIDTTLLLTIVAAGSAEFVRVARSQGGLWPGFSYADLVAVFEALTDAARRRGILLGEG